MIRKGTHQDFPHVIIIFLLCVKWGNSNTGWHINVHHVKLCTHMKCEVKHNWHMGKGHLWLNGWAFMGLALMA